MGVSNYTLTTIFIVLSAIIIKLRIQKQHKNSMLIEFNYRLEAGKRT